MIVRSLVYADTNGAQIREAARCAASRWRCWHCRLPLSPTGWTKGCRYLLICPLLSPSTSTPFPLRRACTWPRLASIRQCAPRPTNQHASWEHCKRDSISCPLCVPGVPLWPGGDGRCSDTPDGLAQLELLPGRHHAGHHARPDGRTGQPVAASRRAGRPDKPGGYRVRVAGRVWLVRVDRPCRNILSQAHDFAFVPTNTAHARESACQWRLCMEPLHVCIGRMPTYVLVPTHVRGCAGVYIASSRSPPPSPPPGRYNRAGLDDAWQACFTGVEGTGAKTRSFHDVQGHPLVNTSRFPDMKGENVVPARDLDRNMICAGL